MVSILFRSTPTIITGVLILMLSTTSISQTLPKVPDWTKLDQPDWLIDDTPFKAKVYQTSDGHLELANGLISRTFVKSPNVATVGLKNLISGEQYLRGIKPEAEITIDSSHFVVGGLVGQTNYAFLRPHDLAGLGNDSSAFQLIDYTISKTEAPFHWKKIRHHDSLLQWPPPGVRLRFDYQAPAAEQQHHRDLLLSIYYELYDGIPVFTKWLTVNNRGQLPVKIDHFSNEILAAVEYGSAVETREHGVQKPNIHVETDFAFSSFNSEDANHHAVHWLPDPQYTSQVNYLKLTPCLLKTAPEIGPSQTLQPGDAFSSFRTFVMPHDSYDRERQGLAIRKMYRTLAPWTTENPLMMHARFADWDRVKLAIDQSAEVGFEMVILTFGSGFNVEDNSAEYLTQMRKYTAYAKSKGVEIGGYSLLASRSIGVEDDVLLPVGMRPTFGNSPCLGSLWAADYFKKLYHFYQTSGFTLLEHDGSYPGDPCHSTEHPGHQGHLDSRWNQYQVISNFYNWCREQGIYLNVPDYYYLSGSNKCGMGYREVNWSLPRAQQVLHTRQNIFDGTWTKTPSMGWMFVPLTEYHGGGAAATIEPLNEHLDHYEQMIMSNLGAGVQACYRGPRLYDSPETRQMVAARIDWFKKHRKVLEGDVMHLRRADGRDIDYWLNVNPKGDEKGLLMVFNPLGHPVERELSIPMYYTGLEDVVHYRHEDGELREAHLSREYQLKIDVSVEAKGFTWFVFEK